MSSDSPPNPATVEAWARAYVLSDELCAKIRPVPPPDTWEVTPPPRDIRPGRPPELNVVERAARSPRGAALVDSRTRARLLHTFWHHELQAAELMCWALLRFPASERDFKKGLISIWRDEVRHMRCYEEQIARLGFALGDFDVRDWFWQRVVTCQSPQSFVALMGMGLEAANLDHAPNFARQLEGAGDPDAARVQRQVGCEELGHVRFATHWFARWSGGVEFAAWLESLPKPLSPLLMRGKRLDREARLAAGMPSVFIDALEAYRPEPHGRR